MIKYVKNEIVNRKHQILLFKDSTLPSFVPFTNNGTESLNSTIKRCYTNFTSLSLNTYLEKLRQIVKKFSKKSRLEGFGEPYKNNLKQVQNYSDRFLKNISPFTIQNVSYFKREIKTSQNGNSTISYKQVTEKMFNLHMNFSEAENLNDYQTNYKSLIFVLIWENIFTVVPVNFLIAKATVLIFT